MSSVCLHLGHGQIIILQERAHKELGAVHILEHDAHERIVDQAELLNLVIIAILPPQFGLVHLHHILTPLRSVNYIVYGSHVCFKG